MTALKQYRAKRDFRKTSEPEPILGKTHRQPIFVIQEHHASRLHYDFRLEADGVLKSWAVPKEPTMDSSVKRLAVHVEDHPLAYAKFHGDIPAGQYGAGHVEIWDHGTYENLLAQKALAQSVNDGVERGRVEVRLHGDKLQGDFALVRMRGDGRGKENWLLIKMKDRFAQPGSAAVSANEPSRKKSPPQPRAKPSAGRPAERTGEPSSETARLTHPDKVMYPSDGYTKADVYDYYRRISSHLLPFLRGRPATLERLPEGVGQTAPHFWQKNTPSYYPDWIARAPLKSESGKPVAYALVDDVDTLLYLVNQGTLTFHVWFSRVDHLDRPDFVLFDLDPGQAPFADVVAVALHVRQALDAEGVEAYVKTSGKTGLHVLTRWNRPGGYDEARSWAQELAAQVARENPALATVEMRKVKRQRRVYVDTLQNARGHHAVPPYVLRAVPGAHLSTPLAWSELTPRLDPQAFNLKTIFRRLARQKRNPLAGLLP